MWSVILSVKRLFEIYVPMLQFHGNDTQVFPKKIKANFAKSSRVRAEDAGTSAAGALVSNPKNKRGVIKAFIVSHRSFLGT